MPEPIDLAMRAAKTWLQQHDIAFQTPTRFQLKVGPLSYYPARGTIFIDGEPQGRADKGLDALAAILHKLGILRGMPPIRGTLD